MQILLQKIVNYYLERKHIDIIEDEEKFLSQSLFRFWFVIITIQVVLLNMYIVFPYLIWAIYSGKINAFFGIIIIIFLYKIPVFFVMQIGVIEMVYKRSKKKIGKGENL